MTAALSSRRPSATLRGMVTAILPAEPALEAASRAAVEEEVTRYVAGQLAAMPSFLRQPFRLALLGFDGSAALRHGRPFRWLPPAAQAAWLATWSEAPLAAMRDVIKLVRSSALLVYFDHPLVRARLEAERRAGSAEAQEAAHG